MSVTLYESIDVGWANPISETVLDAVPVPGRRVFEFSVTNCHYLASTMIPSFEKTVINLGKLEPR